MLNFDWYLLYLFIYLFIIGFTYRLHVLTPRSGQQVRESGTSAPSPVFSCASDHSLVIARKVCCLSAKPQVLITLHYTIKVCCNHTAHSQHCLPATVEVRELNLKYDRVNGELNPRPFALAAEFIPLDHQGLTLTGMDFDR